MNLKFVAALILSLTLIPVAAAAYKFEPGDQVLCDCRQIYTKGVVKAKVDDGYTVHFPKGSGPINCPPFRWHAEFVIAYQSVPEYRLQFFGGLKREVVFRKGETVTLHLETDKRLVKNRTEVVVQAEITDINYNGAIAVKLLDADPEATATFWQLIGGNYIDLRHKALATEVSQHGR